MQKFQDVVLDKIPALDAKGNLKKFAPQKEWGDDFTLCIWAHKFQEVVCVYRGVC